MERHSNLQKYFPLAFLDEPQPAPFAAAAEPLLSLLLLLLLLSLLLPLRALAVEAVPATACIYINC